MSAAYDRALLLLIFNNVRLPGIGDAGGLRPSLKAGRLWWALYSADPAAAISSEAKYAGYSRVGAARAPAGFVVDGNSVSPPGNVDFGKCLGNPGDPITHFGIVSTESGAAILLYSGLVTPAITMAAGVIPRLKPTSTIQLLRQSDAIS